MIGGNIEAMLQQISGSETNSIGERTQTWSDVLKMRGWLDLSSGDSSYTNNAKLQESTHIFITDYLPLTKEQRNAENKRLMVDGVMYDVLFIDDPMELHQQLEISLKYLG